MIEEVEEEYQVRHVHGQAKVDEGIRSIAFDSTCLLYQGSDHGGQSQDKLGQLEDCDHLCHPARDPHPSCLQGVVGVHDGVYGVVGGTRPSGDGRRCCRGPGTVEQHRGVVIPVEEIEWGLAEDDECCVPQLNDLGEDEQQAPEGHVSLI